MKRIWICMFLTLVLTSFSAVNALAAQPGFKLGDEVYTCGCGEGCKCNTVSMKPGKCGCGQDLAKGKVSKMGSGEMTVTPEKGEARIFKTSAKYSCNCPGDCECKTISNKPGKCACGMELK